MALDEALLNWHSEGHIPPTLRFYGWRKPSLSVGHFQKVEKSIHFPGLEKHGCQYVRRLTGGSAVLHDDELTYSIVVSENHPKIPHSIREAYYVLSQGILEGYKNLGIQAEYFIPKQKSKRTAVCFERPAFYELVVDGKKISGNAQTRKKGVLLQHGSIPIRIDIDMLFDLFIFPNERMRDVNKRAFRQKAATIQQLTGKTFTYDEVEQAFYHGFQSTLDVQFKPFELTESQWDEVYQLAEKHYKETIPSFV
ncbi:MAG TPA: lipoate--protein ligase family protein [Cerasibacillus sp.]